MYAVPAAQWPSIAATIGHDAAHRHLLAEQRARAGEGRAARRLDAGAGGVEQPHDRDALAQRQLAHAGHLVLADLAHRAGHDGEVVRADRDAPAVDLADAGDHAVGREVAGRRARGPCGRPACPYSTHVPGSSSRSSRSRTVSLPSERWRSTRSGPPMPSAWSRRACRSPTSGPQSWTSPPPVAVNCSSRSPSRVPAPAPAVGKAAASAVILARRARCHSPGDALERVRPGRRTRSRNRRRGSRTVLVTSTSLGPASAATRAPMCTAIPARSSPRARTRPCAHHCEP